MNNIKNNKNDRYCSKDGDAGLNEYKPIKIIGCGKSSTVIKASFPNSKVKYVAIKITKKSNTINKLIKIIPLISNFENFENEISTVLLISKFYHPNIINYYKIFKSSSSIYLVQELSKNGELNPKFFNLDPIKNLLQMINSINFLHNLNIIHRDIKPSNFLIFQNSIIKLTDFDTCYKLSNDNSKIDNQFLYSNLIGTPLFLPPELISNNSNNNNSNTNKRRNSNDISTTNILNKLFNKKQTNPYTIDLWALGVCLHYFIYNKYPFYADNEFTLLHKIANSDPETPVNSDNIDNLLVKITNLLLIKNPLKRASIKDILKILNNPSLVNPKPAVQVKVYPTNFDINVDSLNSPDTESESDSNSHFDSNTDLENSYANNSGNNTQKYSFKLPIFMSPKKQSKNQSSSTSSLPLITTIPHIQPHIHNHLNLIDDKVNNETNDTKPKLITNNKIVLPNKRYSIQTLPSELSPTRSTIKHSKVINFKKYIQRNNNNDFKDNDNTDVELDKQMAHDYKLYTTMDEYLDNL